MNTENRTSFVALLPLLALLWVPAAVAQEGLVVSFSKTFAPDTIGPGSVTTLQFDIFNGTPSPVTLLAFVDTLPAAVTLATPANGSTTCADGVVTAPDGGGTIIFTDGRLAAFAACQVTVDVTSSTLGTHTNTSGTLTSSAGSHGTATDNLMVAANRPGFSKSFAPSSVPFGQRSTLTFTIDNTANAGLSVLINFADNLPTGMVIADPANAGTTCVGGVLMADPDASLIGYGFPGDASLAAGASCTVSVDVLATGIGTLINVSEDLTSFDSSSFMTVSSGKASASLDVTGGLVTLVKAFTDDPVPVGATVTLEFTITNFDRLFSATGITFTDDLDATLTGLVVTGALPTNPCGAGSTLTGTSLLTLTGGNLPPEGVCTFSVTLQVPVAATPGAFPNTTGSVTATVDGSTVTGDPASDLLFVSNAPILTKSFTDDPAGAGGTVTLEFTVTNPSPTSVATDISFTDIFDIILPTAATLPSSPPCGAGSTTTFTPLINPPMSSTIPAQLVLSGGTLPAGGSCAFSIVLDILPGAAVGLYPNVTSPITATVDAVTTTGASAVDDLAIVAGPSILKSFTDDPVQPGATVTLEFILTHDALATADATGITFTDDLNAVIAGLAATGLPAMDVCGTGSMLTGTTSLTLTGGTLVPGGSCVFSVTLAVPAGATSGAHPNTTSNVMATVGGVVVTSLPAADDLAIAGLTLTKSFTDDPVLPGGMVTLEFTIANISGTEAASGIFFFDVLTSTLSGLSSISGTQNDICGTGSSLSGTTSLIFTGGTLAAGTSCTFTATLQVPAGAASGTYVNTTGSLSATIGGSTIFFDPASDPLTVNDNLLDLAKSFTNDPAQPGGSVNLEFTLTNLSATDAITGITFTDDLDAALSGLVAVGLPAMNVCGMGSTMTGTGLLTLTGGTLAAATSCTWNVSVAVPLSVPLGTVVTNTTSSVTGDAAGLAVTGDPASDELAINFLTFTKSFDGPTVAGGTPVLTLTITNLSATTSVSDISFTDDLDAVLAGLVATNTPQADACGAGSSLAGTSFLTLTGGNLLPGGSCTLVVDLQVPVGAAAGSFLNTTSDLFLAGLSASVPATASLVIESPPTFAKGFAPDTIPAGGKTVLTFTIDNSASTTSATALDFTDTLPPGMSVGSPNNASTTCIGGTLTALRGTNVISYTGGTVGAGAVCTISVDVTGANPGAQVNTSGDLTSSLGNSGPATATVTIGPFIPPTFAKFFAPDSIAPGATSTLTFTIDNAASLLTPTFLSFVDNLPAGVLVATPSNGATTCVGGTLSAVSGSSVVSYSGGSLVAGDSCTVSVDVTSSTPGTHVNLTDDLTSSVGNSGTATDTLTVAAFVPPTFAKVFAPASIAAGGATTLTLTLDNTGSLLAATALDFTDNLPAGVVVATPSNAATTCTGGTLTATSGSATITYTGGTVGASASCTVSVDVVGSTPGAQLNTTGDLTSSLGNSGPATDTLTVTAFVAPVLAKAFSPSSVLINQSSTLVFTIDNLGSLLDATGIALTDNLPVGMALATPANASTTCTGGTLTAPDGGSTLTYTGGTVAAGASCEVMVDVTALVSGDLVNTTDDLTTSLGNSGVAVATLRVAGNPAEIPVLGPWGFAWLISLLAFFGLRSLRRQRGH